MTSPVTRALVAEDLKGSMKLGDRVRVSVLRMLLAEIVADEKAKDAKGAFEATRGYKRKLEKARDEIASQPGHDPQAVAILATEITIVAAYLPKEATPEEIEAHLKGMDLTQPFGAVMKAVKDVFPGAGKVVSETLKRLQGQA